MRIQNTDITTSKYNKSFGTFVCHSITNKKFELYALFVTIEFVNIYIYKFYLNDIQYNKVSIIANAQE